MHIESKMIAKRGWGVEGLSKKEKALRGVDNGMVITDRVQCKGTKR